MAAKYSKKFMLISYTSIAMNFRKNNKIQNAFIENTLEILGLK